MSLSKTPAFNLKAVLHETSIAADTLRAWERRYGLPMPQRSAGGHRMYSQHDIETVKWLMARQSEGLSISRAVDMWNEQTASGADPLAVSASLTVSQFKPYAPESSLDALRAQWLEACLGFHETEAEQLLNQAFAMYSVESVCTDVLQRGMSEMGSQWYANRASVQQEHFASALAMRRLDSLLSASPAPTRGQTILVGCPRNEWHTFTPLLFSLFLRRRGWNVIHLGANVPSNQFQETVEMINADLVVLVAQQLTTAASLQETAQMLAVRGTRVAFGGRIFNAQSEIIRHVAGHYLGASMDSAIGQIDSLMAAPAESAVLSESNGSEIEASGPEFVTAAASFKSRRPQIEAVLYQYIGELGFGAEAMKTATEFLGDNIIAALQFGNMSLVNGEIDWVRSLLKANHVPDQALGQYLSMYANAVTANINGSGRPVTEWLSDQASKNKGIIL